MPPIVSVLQIMQAPESLSYQQTLPPAPFSASTNAIRNDSNVMMCILEKEYGLRWDFITNSKLSNFLSDIERPPFSVARTTVAFLQLMECCRLHQGFFGLRSARAICLPLPLSRAFF